MKNKIWAINVLLSVLFFIVVLIVDGQVFK